MCNIPQLLQGVRDRNAAALSPTERPVNREQDKVCAVMFGGLKQCGITMSASVGRTRSRRVS